MTLSIENNKYYQLLSKLNNNEIVYNHLIDCFNILKDIYPNNYEEYMVPIFLHDIGKFLNPEDKVNHPLNAFNYLYNEYTKDPIILLPIKYHEDDLNWENNIIKDPLYINSHDKEKIILSIKLLRDIDIISNMKKLDCDFEKEDTPRNEELFELLKTKRVNPNICVTNNYDDILYIICGLALIENDECMKYIKDNKIVENLINRLNHIDNKYTEEVSSTVKKLYDL